MTDRAAAIETFLTLAGWHGADRLPLAGDASRRSYVRLLRGAERAMLMDAPPDAEQDVRPFLAIAADLAARGLSVPAILARDARQGFLLLEDLGDDTYTRATLAAPASEPLLYATAAEALAQMQAVPPPDLPRYTDQMPDLAALAIDWYAPEATSDRDALKAAMAEALSHPSVTEDTLVHRDYHADNLLWLPDRLGVARVGLLDFQDAMRGPRDYDIASLIHDPRRVVSPEARQAALHAWQAASGRDAEVIAAGIAICSAQRCLRILGVFARLCLRDGKRHYPDFIPATWAALLSDLAHPALAGLREAARVLPAPTPERLDAIRTRAGTMDGLRKSDPVIATMVFAAGKGTRMRPLTDTRPKALVEVAGRPLIEHALDQVAGPGPTVVNTHHLASQLDAYLADRPDLTKIHEETLLETGGGLRNALRLLGPGPVLTMNADAVWTGPRARDTLLTHWQPETMDGLLLLVPQSRAVGQAGGSFALASDGRLTRDSEGHVYTGAGIVKTEGLAAFPDPIFSLRDLWFAMLAEGRLSGCLHPGHWADVGTPEGIALAEAMLGQTA